MLPQKYGYAWAILRQFSTSVASKKSTSLEQICIPNSTSITGLLIFLAGIIWDQTKNENRYKQDTYNISLIIFFPFFVRSPISIVRLIGIGVN